MFRTCRTFKTFCTYIVQYPLQDAEMPEELAMDIASQIEFNSDILPATGFSTKVFAGVTKDLDQPVFFCVEYAKEEGENTIYIDIGEVDSDTYLDLYLIKQTLQWQT